MQVKHQGQSNTFSGILHTVRNFFSREPRNRLHVTLQCELVLHSPSHSKPLYRHGRARLTPKRRGRIFGRKRKTRRCRPPRSESRNRRRFLRSAPPSPPFALHVPLPRTRRSRQQSSGAFRVHTKQSTATASDRKLSQQSGSETERRCVRPYL